jgi:prepilin-type N-terminal cleavage/methylation domain-containing protein
MRSPNRSDRGLTLVEILVSTILLLIIVAAAYSSFISATRMSIFSRNELEAYQNASVWLEEVRTGATPATRYNNLTATASSVDLNDATSILQKDYMGTVTPSEAWPLASKANITALNAGYTVEDGPYNFKKVTVTVNWTEKE